MWPKALAQLIELAPHLARLLPIADRFFQSKTADAEASRSAMEQMAAGLRGDLGQVTAAHAGLYSQLTEQRDILNDHTAKLEMLSAEVSAARLSAEANATRLAVLEARCRVLIVMASVTLAALVAVIALLLHSAQG